MLLSRYGVYCQHHATHAPYHAPIIVLFHYCIGDIVKELLLITAIVFLSVCIAAIPSTFSIHEQQELKQLETDYLERNGVF